MSYRQSLQFCSGADVEDFKTSILNVGFRLNRRYYDFYSFNFGNSPRNSSEILLLSEWETDRPEVLSPHDAEAQETLDFLPRSYFNISRLVFSESEYRELDRLFKGMLGGVKPFYITRQERGNGEILFGINADSGKIMGLRGKTLKEMLNGE